MISQVLLSKVVYSFVTPLSPVHVDRNQVLSYIFLFPVPEFYSITLLCMDFLNFPL
eukprot:UN10347